MSFIQNKIVGAFLFAGLTLGCTVANAQNRVGTAVQQGHGAYVAKTDRSYCMENSILGIPTLPASGCVDMTQVKFNITPSGNSSAIWKGTVPVGSRPTQRVVFNSTYTEIEEGPTKGQVYSTVAVTEPSGDVTLTYTLKGNGNGNGNGRNNGRKNK